jgi:hypothetical protein
MPPMPPNVDPASAAVGPAILDGDEGFEEEEVTAKETLKQEQPKQDETADMEVGGGGDVLSPDTTKPVLSHRDMDDTRTQPFVVIIACAAALGGLIFGYDIGGAGKS